MRESAVQETGVQETGVQETGVRVTGVRVTGSGREVKRVAGGSAENKEE